MAFTKAGLWGPQAIIDSTGHPQPGATATLYLPDEVTLASLWTTSAKSVAVANPTQADIHANLHFWTDPGQYRLRVNVGTVVTWLDVEVPIDPGEAAQDQDVVAAQAAAEAYADGIVAAALAAALAASQPLDADLTAIAALATTAFGRALLILADAAALRTAAGLGTAATHAVGDFDAAGTAAAAVAAVVAGAPGALDTLNELATALADDANFATTVTNALATKVIAGATSGTANQAALPAAVAHTHEIVKTDDGGVYLSTGSSWVEVVPPSLKLTPTAVKTGNYTAAVGDYVLADTSGGIFTVTLPTAPADKTSIAVDLVASGSTLTIARGGADVFQKAGGPTALTMNTANRVLVLQYQSSIAVWHVQDHLPAVITTKGDLLTYGTERARLAVGADGALLGADSSTATGLKWIPSGTYVPMTGGTLTGPLRAPNIVADGSPWFDVTHTAFGATSDAIKVSDGTMNVGSPNLHSASWTFTSADVGKSIATGKTSAGGGTQIGTILALAGAHDITLSYNAGSTVTGTCQFTFGTDNTAALNAAAAAAGNSGTVFVPASTGSNSSYLVLGNVTIPYDRQTWLCHGAIFRCATTSGVAFQIGDPLVTHSHPTWHGGRIIRAAGQDVTAGTIGFEIVNTNYAHAYDFEVNGFDVGLRLRGVNLKGCQYTMVMPKVITANNTNIEFVADGDVTCWCNENTVLGGAITAPTTGNYDVVIHVVNGATQYPNNNKVWASDLEAGGVSGTLGAVYCDGLYNEFRGCRYEGFTSPFIVEGAHASRNLYDGGRGLIDETVLTRNATGASRLNGLTGGTTYPTTQFNAPAAPPTSVSTTAVMAGLGITYTPKFTGNLRVVITGVAGTQTAVVSYSVGGRWGTGSAPANGAATSGTAFAQGLMSFKEVSTSAGIGLPFTCVEKITGRTLGTAVWIDLQYLTSNAADAVYLQNLTVEIQEVG